MAVQFYNFLALLCVFAAVVTAQTSTGETTQPKLSWKNFKTAHKLKCKPGEYAVCKPCPRDQMTKKESVVGQCVDCTLYGKGTPKEGSSRCRGKCAPGEKYVDSSSTCEPCEAGTYMDIRGLNDTCKSCGPNMTSEARARKCECMAGFQQVNGRCEACPEGRFKPEKGNSSCSKCPTNTTTLMDGAKNNKTECVLSCLPGQQYNQTTQVCDPCKPGFSKELGGRRTKCEPCPINTVAPKNGSRRCNVKCGKGYELTADGCKNCTWNTYKNRLGNDACTPCPVGTHTWSKGAKNHHECINDEIAEPCPGSTSACVAPAISQIEYFYKAMESITLSEDADLIDAVLATCGTGLQDTFKAFMSGFSTCLELINVKLPTVDITGRMYEHEDQMNLILDILNYQKNRPDGDYCEYLGCVTTKGWEVQDCIWEMTDKTTGHPHDFCSQSGRVGASCVMMNFKSCPALKYSKVAEKIKVAGVSKLVQAKDVPSFCAGEEGEDSGIWNGGETGGGSCEDHLKQILSELQMSAASDICSESYRLRPALSCFEEHATEDIFNNLYRSQINNLIPSAAVVGLPEMTLRELIDYLDTSCVNTGDCGAALKPLLNNLDASKPCAQYDHLRPALSCFLEYGMEQIFMEQYKMSVDVLFVTSTTALGQNEMSLHDIIYFLDDTCSSTGSCGDQLMPVLTTLDMSNMCSQYPSLRSALSCFVDNGQEHMFTEEHRANIEPLIMSISPVVHTAGMSLNEMISILDTTCSSTGSCGDQLMPVLTTLDMSNMCSQYSSLRSALSCFVDNGQEHMFTEEHRANIEPLIMSISPVVHTAGMSLNEMISILDTTCSSTGGCASLLDPQLLDLSMSNLCSRLDPLLQALRCYQGENEMEFMQLYYDRIFYMIDVAAEQYFTDVNSMTLQDIIYFLEMHCHSQGTGGEQSPCALGMEHALNYPLDVTNFCDGASFLVDAMRCFGLNEEEFVMSEYSARLSAIIPYTFADTMPLSDIIAGIENYCPGMPDGGDGGETGGIGSECTPMLESVGTNTLAISNLCDRSDQIQNTLNCYQTSNPAELMNVLDEIFYKIDLTVETLFSHLLDARGMITPKNMTHFLKVYCGPGECIHHDRILKEVTLTNVCNSYDGVKSALSCFMYHNLADHFWALYSDSTWLGVFGVELSLQDIMNFLVVQCESFSMY